MGNASMDDTDVATALTFFFTTDGKSFEHLTYSSIYFFKRPSSSAGRDFIDGVLNMGGFGEGEGGGTSNEAATP
jgi:hypothetical protein